jgi:3-hydroxyacyl-CoA dehydrogenase/3a,7a,12a-trihydroxy-5b-cholest-24-enoyl-CoA hydratase
VAAHPDLVGKIGKVYLFKLKGPDSTWTVDLKTDKGAVKSGAAGKADCTLELTDADFLAMCTGQVDSMKLYTSGKLKISGDVMASQKLEFLKKIDPKLVQEAAQKGPAAAPTAAEKPASTGPSAAEVFANLKGRLPSKGASLVSEVGAVVQVLVREPDSAWVLDLKSGTGAVREGKEAATTTVTVSEADLAALAKGEATVKELYQHGQLRVDGDIRPVQKLGFLKLNA